MYTRKIEYSLEGKIFQGFLAVKKERPKQPGILLAHAWQGQDDFVREKAKWLAEIGYVGFAIDLYGGGVFVESKEEARNLMLPLFVDRKELQKRIKAAYETLKKQPEVDEDRIGAIGFCFGGLTVIELLRSGIGVKGVVSFHAVIGDTMGETKAKTVPIAKGSSGSILILHGYDDPLVTQKDIQVLQEELDQVGIDWQMNIYGHTMHAFTNPKANEGSIGLLFNPKTNRRAWESMQLFFAELFENRKE